MTPCKIKDGFEIQKLKPTAAPKDWHYRNIGCDLSMVFSMHSKSPCIWAIRAWLLIPPEFPNPL